MNVYATIDEIKLDLGQDWDITADDTMLRRKAIEASRFVDGYTRRRFYPAYATYQFDHPASSRCTLLLDRDLLSVSSLTTDNGNTTITSNYYFPLAGDSHTHTPYNQIALNTDTNVWEWSTTQRASNTITGIWGFHNDWSNAWGLVDTVQDNPLGIAATSLVVADADGIDERGLKPRFQVGQLIRFGNSVTAEYAHITEIVGETLTIVRGVNGSTAAEQAESTSIYVYRPQYDIAQATLFLAMHLYRRKDSIGSLSDQPIASPTGVILSASIPSEVIKTLDLYRLRLP